MRNSLNKSIPVFSQSTIIINLVSNGVSKKRVERVFVQREVQNNVDTSVIPLYNTISVSMI